MRLLSVYLLVCAMLVTDIPVAAAPWPRAPLPKPDGGGCGPDDPSGLVLYHVYDAEGSPAKQSLALVGSDGKIRGTVDIPEARDMTPTPSGCRAMVRTATGATFAVDGADGSFREIELDDPYNNLRLSEIAEDGRWGIFVDYAVGRYVLVDFVTGAATDLKEFDPSLESIGYASISPDGTTLVVGTYAELWLFTTDEPRKRRRLGDGYASFIAFDASGERVLYVELSDDRTQTLVVEDTADESSKSGVVIATAPAAPGSGRFLWGSFVPGGPEIAVLFPDRFAVVDLDKGRRRERFSIPRTFSDFYPAPSGQSGILIGVDATDDTDPSLTFVDLIKGTTTPIEDDGGDPLRIQALEGQASLWKTVFPGRWMLLSVGGTRDAPQALASLDAETGRILPLLTVAEGSWDQSALRLSDNGRTVLVTQRDVEGNTRVTLIDAETGVVTEVVQAPSVAADLSLDGQWIAYSTLETTDTGRATALVLVETATGATTPIGPGLSPVWLAP